MKKNKTAIIIGATGLVGGKLLNYIINDEVFSKVLVFTRRKIKISSPKIEEHIIDFSEIESIKDKIRGDAIFSCLGTTLKQAGGKKAQYEVDYTYQYLFAKFASQNNVGEYFLVSSSGANDRSRFFYLKMKGELETDVCKLNFNSINIFQPSVLIGEREQKRTGEIIGAKMSNFFTKIIPPLKKYRGIKGETVAKAMINTYKLEDKDKINIFKLDEIHNLA